MLILLVVACIVLAGVSGYLYARMRAAETYEMLQRKQVKQLIDVIVEVRVDE